MIVSSSSWVSRWSATSCGAASRDSFALRLAHDVGDPRVRVLHVVDRILRRLLLGQLEIELEVAVRLAREKEEAHHVGARPRRAARRA